MFYVVNNHLNNLYVLSNKAVGPGKKIINVGPLSIPEARHNTSYILGFIHSSQQLNSRGHLSRQVFELLLQ